LALRMGPRGMNERAGTEKLKQVFFLNIVAHL